MTTGHFTTARPPPITRYPSRIRWRRYSGNTATALRDRADRVRGSSLPGPVTESESTAALERLVSGSVEVMHSACVRGWGAHIRLRSAPARPKSRSRRLPSDVAGGGGAPTPAPGHPRPPPPPPPPPPPGGPG